MAAAVMHAIDVLGVQKMGAPQGLRESILRCRGANDMHMIGHQAIPVDTQSILRPLRAQQFQVNIAVVIYKKDILFIVAPLGDVMRYLRDHYACCSGHEAILSNFRSHVNNNGDCPLLSTATSDTLTIIHFRVLVYGIGLCSFVQRF